MISLLLGHYVSDGMDLDVEEEDLSDRWFTYNDAVVTKTTGHSVCAKRRNSSYMLFYKRHVSELCTWSLTEMIGPQTD